MFETLAVQPCVHDELNTRIGLCQQSFIDSSDWPPSRDTNVLDILTWTICKYEFGNDLSLRVYDEFLLANQCREGS